MVRTTKRKQTKKRNSKTKNQNKNTKKKQNRKTTKKQKGGNNDELNMIIQMEDLDALKSYVEQGGNINKKGSGGVTGLMEAVAIQDIPKVTYLIDKGADVNAVDDNGTTAYSIAFGNDAITDLLKDAGAKTDPTYLLMLAIENNNVKSAKTMIKNKDSLGININDKGVRGDGYSALHKAVDKGNVEIVKVLIDAGADVNIRTADHFENTPLLLAAYNENLEIVKLLVEAGADIDIDNNEDTDAPFAAYENGDMEMVRYFSDEGNPGARNLLIAMQEELDQEEIEQEEILEEPKKKDTKTVVQQIQPKPIEEQTKTKTIPKVLQGPDPSFYDVIDMEEKQVKEFLKEDPNNILFVYGQQMIGTNKEQLKNEMTTNRTKIMLECIEPKPAFHQPESNIVKDDEGNLQYYLNMDILGLLGVMVNIAQLKTIVGVEQVMDSPPITPDFSPPGTPDFSPPGTPPFLSIYGLSPINGGNHNARIFVVDTSDDPKTQRAITSFGAYDWDNVVSAKHCAEEEPMRIGKLYSTELPSTPKKKRTRSKSPKKNTTRRKGSKSKST